MLIIKIEFSSLIIQTEDNYVNVNIDRDVFSSKKGKTNWSEDPGFKLGPHLRHNSRQTIRRLYAPEIKTNSRKK